MSKREIRITFEIDGFFEDTVKYRNKLDLVYGMLAPFFDESFRVIADNEPRCDICGELQLQDEDPDWNGETGNHLSCEDRRYEEQIRLVIP